MNPGYCSCVPEAAVILNLAAAYCGQRIDDRGKKRKEKKEIMREETWEGMAEEKMSVFSLSETR